MVFVCVYMSVTGRIIIPNRTILRQIIKRRHYMIWLANTRQIIHHSSFDELAGRRLDISTIFGFQCFSKKNNSHLRYNFLLENYIQSMFCHH